MVAEEIALENKEKQLSTLKQNQDNRSVQMDKTDDNKKSHTSPTHTREQVAKMSGVRYGTLAYKTKEEVMEWMLDIQLGRRNLSPIQRIAIAEKYRSIYEKQALINKQNAMREARKNNENNKNEQLSVNLPKTVPISTSEKLAEVANVSEKTYRMGTKILNSDNEDLKKKVLANEVSINAGTSAIIMIKYAKITNVEQNL